MGSGVVNAAFCHGTNLAEAKEKVAAWLERSRPKCLRAVARQKDTSEPEEPAAEQPEATKPQTEPIAAKEAPQQAAPEREVPPGTAACKAGVPAVQLMKRLELITPKQTIRPKEEEMYEQDSRNARKARADLGQGQGRSSRSIRMRMGCSPPRTRRNTSAWSRRWLSWAASSTARSAPAQMERELNAPTMTPLASRPEARPDSRPGRSSDEYKAAFWTAMRNRGGHLIVQNALQIGDDAEGGYLVPDEYERTLVDALQEENRLRGLCKIIRTSSGDRKIPLVASHGTGQLGRGGRHDPRVRRCLWPDHHRGTQDRVHDQGVDELLQDSVFDIASYIATEFARRVGDAEEAAFISGDGSGKPYGMLHATNGAAAGVTAASATAITADELLDLIYSLRAPYRKRRGVPDARFDHQGHPQTEGRKRTIPLAAGHEGGRAGYAAGLPAGDLDAYAGDRGGGKADPLRRPDELLDRGPRGPLHAAAERTVCGDRPGGLRRDAARGRKAGADRGPQVSGHEERVRRMKRYGTHGTKLSRARRRRMG